MIPQSQYKAFARSREHFADPRRYSKLAGKLNYLTITQLDISFVVKCDESIPHSPCKVQWDAVVQILGYNKGSPRKCILYEHKGHNQTVGYSYVDWASSLRDQHSTLGCHTLIGGNLISLKCKKASVVTRLV